MLGPGEGPGLEEGAVDDQLAAALEQIEQAYLALGSVELVLLVDSQPRRPPAFGGQRIPGAGESLLLNQKLLVRSLPLLLRHDRGCVHFNFSFVRCHFVAFLSMDSCVLRNISLLGLPVPGQEKIPIRKRCRAPRDVPGNVSNVALVAHEINLARNVEMPGVTSVAGFGSQQRSGSTWTR